MLHDKSIGAATTASIVNDGLESQNANVQIFAADVMNNYPEAFLEDAGTVHFPSAVDLKWNTQLPVLAREAIANCLILMVLSRPFWQWIPTELNHMVVNLWHAWKSETEYRIKNGVGLCLSRIIASYPREQELYPPSGKLRIAELRIELDAVDDSASAIYTTHRQLAVRLEAWVAKTNKATK